MQLNKMCNEDDCMIMFGSLIIHMCFLFSLFIKFWMIVIFALQVNSTLSLCLVEEKYEGKKIERKNRKKEKVKEKKKFKSINYFYMLFQTYLFNSSI